jgi:hypothetical protein
LETLGKAVVLRAILSSYVFPHTRSLPSNKPHLSISMSGLFECISATVSSH